MLTLPTTSNEISYQACCGKTLCAGCICEALLADSRQLCPFCRIPFHKTDEEYTERLKKRAATADVNAMRMLGCYYQDGEMGLPQDHAKAIELWLRAGELGDAGSHHNVGNAYLHGLGVERDTTKATYYYELAAMVGNVDARHNLGIFEKNEGNMERAVKHFMIAAGAGCDDSLKQIRNCFTNGHATKDDFEKALRAHKEAKDEMKSDQRDAAIAARAVAHGQN